MPAQPLSPEQLDDARRLKALYQAKKASLNLTQETLAAACGWESQGSVSQYLNGKIPLNLDAAIKLARSLRCAVGDFSPRIAESLPADLPSASDKSGASASVTHGTSVSPSSNTHTDSDTSHSATTPLITYEVVKGAVAGVLQAMGVRYEDLVEDDDTARRRIEKALRTEGHLSSVVPPAERRQGERRKAQSWKRHVSAPALPQREKQKKST